MGDSSHNMDHSCWRFFKRALGVMRLGGGVKVTCFWSLVIHAPAVLQKKVDKKVEIR